MINWSRLEELVADLAALQSKLDRAVERKRVQSIGELLLQIEHSSEDVRRQISDHAASSSEDSDSTRNVSEDLFQSIETPKKETIELWRTIPAGSFLMGSPLQQRGASQECPRHRVTISSAFRIAAVPVTIAQFAAFRTPPPFSHQDGHPYEYAPRDATEEELAFYPATGITWNCAMEFCQWLAETFSWARGARLPTEEEWEYACRAGTDTRYWSGDQEADLARVGWYKDNSDGRTHRVGEKPANPWGLYDMHGNVQEWTLSPWRDYTRDEVEVIPAAIDPEDYLETESPYRMARSGSVSSEADRATAAWRVARAKHGSGAQGLRIVLPEF